MLLVRFLALAVVSRLTAGSPPVVVVTGATGRSGILFYRRLKRDGIYQVRALVRNATKAKHTLECSKCDESEGVYVGDVTKPETLKTIMLGADVLAIFSASVPQCSGIPFGPFGGKCTYPKGGEPKAIDFLGTKAQVAAFASAGGDVRAKHVLYMSTMDTTQPDNFLDKLGNAYGVFYHLQGEASIMASGVPFTIAKACGLSDGDGGKAKFTVGHDDDTFSYTHVVKRDDVAHVLVEAVKNKEASTNLRFDLCTAWLGAATTDIVGDVFRAARYPWQSRALQTGLDAVVV